LPQDRVPENHACSKGPCSALVRLLAGPPLRNEEGVVDGLNTAESLSQGSEAFSTSLLLLVGQSMVRWQMPSEHAWQHHTPDKAGPSDNIVCGTGKDRLSHPPAKHPLKAPYVGKLKSQTRQNHAKSTVPPLGGHQNRQR